MLIAVITKVALHKNAYHRHTFLTSFGKDIVEIIDYESILKSGTYIESNIYQNVAHLTV